MLGSARIGRVRSVGCSRCHRAIRRAKRNLLSRAPYPQSVAYAGDLEGPNRLGVIRVQAAVRPSGTWHNALGWPLERRRHSPAALEFLGTRGACLPAECGPTLGGRTDRGARVSASRWWRGPRGPLARRRSRTTRRALGYRGLRVGGPRARRPTIGVSVPPPTPPAPSSRMSRHTSPTSNESSE